MIYYLDNSLLSSHQSIEMESLEGCFRGTIATVQSLIRAVLIYYNVYAYNFAVTGISRTFAAA